MADHRSAYATLADLFGTVPTVRALQELAQRLATSISAGEVHLWRARRGGVGVELSWPTGAPQLPDVIDAATLQDLPGVDAVGLIQDDATLRGAITVTFADRHQPDAGELRYLAETADCVLLLWRRDDLETAVQQQTDHTSRLAGELSDSGRRLSTVRDLERRRVAVEMITLSTVRLGRLHQRVAEFDVQLSAGQAPPASSVDGLRDLIDELIEDFREMVRGIHPQVLQARGPRAALAEVAAGLARPARITGTVPARIDPELGASLYYLTASALQVLADTNRPEGHDPLQVRLSHHDQVLRVQVTGQSRISAAALRAALTVDGDRIAALGGGLDVRDDAETVEVRAWLPDRLEPAAQAPAVPPTSVPARVRALALGVAARYGEGQGTARAQALVSRLGGPVRVGVQGFEGSPRHTAWLTALGRRLPDVELEPYPATGSDDQPDCILRPTPRHPAERVDLVLPGAGLLLHSARWAQLPDLLATELVARATLLRTRSALAALIRLARDVPLSPSSAQWLAYELEELQASGHQLAELEALAQLRTGALPLPRAELRRAERLLGCAGEAAPDRLGLPAAAGPAELVAAATEALEQWRRLAETATAGRRQRQACLAIVRSCEGIVSELS